MRHLHTSDLTAWQWNLLAKVFATAILETKDESGDFATAATDLAAALGLKDMLKTQLAEVERRTR